MLDGIVRFGLRKQKGKKNEQHGNGTYLHTDFLSGCNHNKGLFMKDGKKRKSDLIDRQAAIDEITEYGSGDTIYMSVVELKRRIEHLPSVQPEQDILSWLLAYHTKSFDLHGRYMPHEVIGWLVHDFANAYMAERWEE